MLSKLVEAARIVVNPSRDELRTLALPGEMTTEFDSAAYVTRVRSRSAAFTRTSLDHGFNEQDLELVERVRDFIKDKELLQVDRSMGVDPEHSFQCRLYIRPQAARVALMWHKSLFPAVSGEREPDFVTLYIPEWEERKVLVDVESGVTFVLGIDYYGEAKKSFLRQGMYAAKTRWGGIGLHAGSKILRVRDSEGALQDRGAIFFGLSGTGKTSLTCHPHQLSGEEGVEILQDDVVLMAANGACFGTEDGFFIKTEGLDPEDQPSLYKAATTPEAVLENVWVNPDRDVDFFNTSLTQNGRAIVLREEVEGTSHRIDLERAHLIFFITRNETIVPPVARLSAEQAAAAFMLGESIKTSAADPSAQGEPVRCVGTNPFIVGSRAEEGNRFLEILRRNEGDIQCFLLNTGGVGGKQGQDIRLRHSQGIIREIARESVEWEKESVWGYELPTSIPGIEPGQFDPQRFYAADELAELSSSLKVDRKAWLESFDGLDSAIVRAFD